MSYASLIGSKIILDLKKTFHLLKFSSTSVLLHDIKLKHPIHMIFNLRTSIMHFYSSMIFRDIGTVLRKNLMKVILLKMKNSSGARSS
jgi:hypothetical protein